MSVPNIITRGIGPQSTIPQLITAGLIPAATPPVNPNPPPKGGRVFHRLRTR